MNTAKQKRVVTLNQVAPEPVEWLWPGRIAAGTLTLIDGDPEQGKSLLMIELAARLSTGRSLADGHTPPQPCSVILLTSEDILAQTVQPRLQAAGADLTRVHEFRVQAADGQAERPPTFPDDCDLLRETILETAARLVVVDPLLAFLSTGISNLNDQLIRRALDPLTDVAEQTRAGIIMSRHLTKGSHGRLALYRGAGAMALIGAARTAFVVGRHPHDPELRLLACTKNNLGPPPPTLAFRPISGPLGQAVIEWTGIMPIAADEMLRPAAPESPGALEEATALLHEVLRHGPATAETVYRIARASGISDRTLERAKSKERVVSEEKRENDQNVWYWSLPRDTDSERIMRNLLGL